MKRWYLISLVSILASLPFTLLDGQEVRREMRIFDLRGVACLHAGPKVRSTWSNNSK